MTKILMLVLVEKCIVQMYSFQQLRSKVSLSFTIIIQIIVMPTNLKIRSAFLENRLSNQNEKSGYTVTKAQSSTRKQ